MYQQVRTAGFTLVELVITLVLLGVLAVAVLPRFQDTSGVAEYTYRARLISALRTMQLRAMQDTRANFCFQVNFVNGVGSAFGPPTLDYTGTAVRTCAASISTAIEDSFAVATDLEMAADGVVLAGAPATLEFRDLGQPFVAGVQLVSPLQISLSGIDSLNVCVEAEGYIHAC